MKFKIQNLKFKILGFLLAFLTFTFLLLTFSSPVFAQSNCPLSDPSASNDAFINNCSIAQLETLSNQRLLGLSPYEGSAFGLNIILQMSRTRLGQFSNGDLIKIGQDSGNLSGFLAGFSNDRLLNPRFSNDILLQLPTTTIDSFSCTIRAELGRPCSDTSGTPPVAPGPPSAGAPKGSECSSFQVIDSTTKDVTAGPIYENEKYVFKLSFKNKVTAGEPQSWTKATHKLQALGNTVALWGTQAIYPLTQDTVAKDNIEVFNIDATAGVLPEGKNFEERPFHYSMADASGTFGAACLRNITVLKKPAGLSTTKCYVISEDASEVDNVTSCDDPKARTYTAHPTSLSYPFKTPLVAGTPRTIYVKFFDNNGKSSGTPFTKTIVYTPPASISGIDCSYDSSSLATTYTIRGTSLGSQTANTKVKVGNADAVVTAWTATTITAKLDQRLEGSNSVSVSLDDGKKLDGTCAVGTTTATLSVKNKCATAETVNTDDVEVSIYESGTQPFVKQKIRPDKDGNLAGFAPKLEKNKKYTALFKKPGFLTKKVEFNTTSGTAVAEAAVLIPGDIAPRASPDNVINSFDFSELKTQWDLIKDVTRTGDLNKDSRVNSFDWSCMKSSSNLQGDIFTGASSTTPPPSSTQTVQMAVTGKVFLDKNGNNALDPAVEEVIASGVKVKLLKVPDAHVVNQELTATEKANSQLLQEITSTSDGAYNLSANIPSAGGNFSLLVDPGGNGQQGGQVDFRIAGPVTTNFTVKVDFPVKPTVN